MDKNTELIAQVQRMLEEDRAEMELLEKSFQDQLERVQKPEVEPVAPCTFGEKLSDLVAEIGGTWGFIIAACFIISGWITFNSTQRHGFDPFPFILLNLVLSCLAALQAPVIMMSQNRQEQKDRARSIHDYEVNRVAEFEIRRLHDKVDQLQNQQMRRLLEIQRLQMILMTQSRSLNE